MDTTELGIFGGIVMTLTQLMVWMNVPKKAAIPIVFALSFVFAGFAQAHTEAGLHKDTALLALQNAVAVAVSASGIYGFTKSFVAGGSARLKDIFPPNDR
jgi:hypothetical protein